MNGDRPGGAAERGPGPDERERARSLRFPIWAITVLFLGSIGAILFAFERAYSGSNRKERTEELAALTNAFRDALADRAKYEEKVASLESRAAKLEGELSQQKSAAGETAAELDRTRSELAVARQKVFESEVRAADEKKGIDKLFELVEKQRANPGAPADDGAASQARGDENIVGIHPADGLLKPGGPAHAAPLPERAVRELNALLAYSTQTSLGLLEAKGPVNGELREAFFASYSPSGKPTGFVSAARVSFEESSREPRLRMRLHEGFDLIGKSKTPFANRGIDFRAVDPAEWKRRIPEIFAGASLATDSRPAEPAPRNPQITAMIARLNRLFAAHTDYVRLRIDDLLSWEAGSFYGVALTTLVQERGSSEPRIDELVRARRMTLTYRSAERRLEIDLEDGTRGRGKSVPFPGNKVRFLLPGVDSTELAGGEPPLPLQKE